MSAINPHPVRKEIRNQLINEALSELIEQAINSVNDLGPDFIAEREKLSELRQRLQEERFHLAVLGQFKRGKSTLINALLGEKILPTAVVPLTAIPTLVSAGPDKAARVSYSNGREDEALGPVDGDELSTFLAKFVTESENPKNELGVSSVEVFHPAGFLTKGVVLADTPGIGSTYRHNTEATINFLSQCDAALFVSSVDPPITEVEVNFLKEVRNKVAHLIFLFNKTDYLEESEKQDAVEFYKKALREEAGFSDDPPIFCVSARQGLEGKLSGCEEKWRQSGLAAFEKHLMEFLVDGKARILNRALASKTLDIVSGVKAQLQIMIQSLQMPLDELDDRRQALSKKLGEIERQAIAAGDLLEGDRRRTLEYLEKQAENLRGKARQYLNEIVKKHYAASTLDQAGFEQAIAGAIPELFEHELGDMARTFDHHVTEVLQPHQRRAESLIGEIRKSAAELFDIPYRAPETADVFEMKRKPYWIVHKWPSSIHAIPPEWIDKLLPVSVRRSRMIKRLEAQVEDLVSHNVENLRWETLQNLNATFSLFATGLKEQLRLTLVATHGAIQAAWEKRQNRANTVDGEIAELENAVARFGAIEKELTVKGGSLFLNP